MEINLTNKFICVIKESQLQRVRKQILYVPSFTFCSFDRSMKALTKVGEQLKTQEEIKKVFLRMRVKTSNLFSSKSSNYYPSRNGAQE